MCNVWHSNQCIIYPFMIQTEVVASMVSIGIHRTSTLQNQVESKGIQGNPWESIDFQIDLIGRFACGIHGSLWIPSESLTFHGIPKSICIPSGCVWNSKVLKDTRDQTVNSERSERVTDLSHGRMRTHATSNEGRPGTKSNPQAVARMTPTPASDTAAAHQPLLPVVQNGRWPASKSSYLPPTSLLFSPHIPTAQTPLSPAMTPTNRLMYPGFPFHSHTNVVQDKGMAYPQGQESRSKFP